MSNYPIGPGPVASQCAGNVEYCSGPLYVPTKPGATNSFANQLSRTGHSLMPFIRFGVTAIIVGLLLLLFLRLAGTSDA